jgi:hypothetical protein
LPAPDARQRDLLKKSGQNADQVSGVRFQASKRPNGSPETRNLQLIPYRNSRVEMPQQGALEKLLAIVFGDIGAQDLACVGGWPDVGAQMGPEPASPVERPAAVGDDSTAHTLNWALS